MGPKNGEQVQFNVETKYGGVGIYLQKFKLYETCSNFYMTGWDKNRTCWKVLKINRLEKAELSITEDSTAYSQVECDDILKRIYEGNKSTGGLKFVTTCYGIVGFIKLLGPYYMLLITKRQKIGTICGHAVYSIAKSKMILIQSNMTYSKNENRYKKLLRTVDLTKDFFFSYSYHVMLSLQKNLSNHETGLHLYETLFVWNEFLTRGIRNQLKNSVWTVALVHGFFKQDKLSINGRDFNLILIARRSRHYAGTRYLKRGVNDKGRVANDVETEQIVLEDISEGYPSQISSVVQNRGSVPLFWSQESSRLNIKPDIILSKKDPRYKATKLHFENLVKRYGNPIIILNLIKAREKKPRESILLAEFANAIEVINKDLARENRLKLYHLDLNRYSRINGAYAMAYLIKGAANVFDLTGFFYCQLPSSASKLSSGNNCNGNDNTVGDPCNMIKDVHLKMERSIIDKCDVGRSHFAKPPMFQKGVLRTNCIDCLDRTNVAQYAFALVALGFQLHALGYIDNPTINLESPLAHDFMRIYEEMGDTLALQYGGSAAHNKIFAEIRGQWKAATQSQEFFRSLHRFYSNAYMDAEKQDAINVFLGHFLPQQGKPALWELDSDQYYTAGSRGSILAQHARSTIKRSLSDGNILSDSSSAIEREMNQMDDMDKILGQNNPSHATPEISTSNSDISCSRYTSSMFSRQLFRARQPEQYLENDSICVTEREQPFNCSNFLDADRLSSSGTCEEDTYERSLLIGSPTTGVSSGYESGLSLEGKEKDSETPIGFSERFLHWLNGDSLFP